MASFIFLALGVVDAPFGSGDQRSSLTAGGSSIAAAQAQPGAEADPNAEIADTLNPLSPVETGAEEDSDPAGVDAVPGEDPADPPEPASVEGTDPEPEPGPEHDVRAPVLAEEAPEGVEIEEGAVSPDDPLGWPEGAHFTMGLRGGGTTLGVGESRTLVIDLTRVLDDVNEAGEIQARATPDSRVRLSPEQLLVGREREGSLLRRVMSGVWSLLRRPFSATDSRLPPLEVQVFGVEPGDVTVQVSFHREGSAVIAETVTFRVEGPEEPDTEPESNH